MILAIGRTPIPSFFLLWAILAVRVPMVVACASPTVERDGLCREETNRPAQEANQVREVRVGPVRVECYGPFRRMCLVVDEGLFYIEIEGFKHEPGYEYRLRIERYDAWPGQKEPLQDAGRYGYRLLEVVSKTRASGMISEVTVAPARVQCPRSDERCLLVDGRSFPDAIGGFRYEPGFVHRVRIESFGDGSHCLLEVIDGEPASGTVEEISVGPWCRSPGKMSG